MERFCRFLPWTPWPSCKYSAACSCCAFTKPNALQNRSCIIYCPGCIRDFQVYAGSPVDAAEIASLQSQARYITRPAVAMDALQKLDDGKPGYGYPSRSKNRRDSSLDPLEWIHRLTSHIPDPGRHCQRFYGAYANAPGFQWTQPMGKSAASPAGRFGFSRKPAARGLA